MRAKDSRRTAPCRRQTRLRRRSGRILWALSLALAPMAHSLADPALEEAYGSYYEALDGFGPEDLTRELGATIDDVLSQGSHLSRPSTAYKRRQISEGLLQRARKSLCAGDRSSSSAVRTACITGTRNAAEEAGTRFTPADVGMVAAVCARLMEAEPPGVQCAAH